MPTGPVRASMPLAESIPKTVTTRTASKPLQGFSANTAAVFGAQVGRVLMAMLLEVLYARLLGPSGRGQMGLCMMANGVGVLLGGLGGEVPIMLWAADEKKHGRVWFGSVFLCGVVGSFLSVGLWVGVYWWWRPAFLRGITPILAWLLVFSIPASVLASYFGAMLVGLNWLRERSLLLVANQFLLLAFATILLNVFHPRAEFAMFAIVLASVCTILIAVRQLRHELNLRGNWRVGLHRVADTLRLGVRSQLGNVATFFNYRLDVFIVNYYLNTTEVGLYALGVMISEALWQVPNAAATALLPRTARSADAESTAFTCLVCRQVFAIACITALFVAVLSPFLVPLIFGQRFHSSVAVIWWILPGTVVYASAKVMSAELLGRGWPEYASIIAILTLCLTITLDLYLVPRRGIQGAAIASSLAYLFNSLLIAAVLKRKLGVTWRSLYLPSLSEFALYRQIWTRFVTWLAPSLEVS